MVMLNIRPPGGGGAERVEVVEGHALLVGRAPDASRLDASDLDTLPSSVRTLRVSSPLVSENHLLAWVQGGRLSLRDLGSRNGTMALLPPMASALLPLNGEITIQLVSPTPLPRESPPKDADGATEEQFVRSIAGELTVWLEQLGLSATVEACPTDATAPPRSLESIPVLRAHQLHVIEHFRGSTHGASLPGAMETIWKYVLEQSARFRIENEKGSTIVRASPTFRRAFREVLEAAARGVRVILQGETGVGKGVLAQAYANRSNGDRGAFVELNCATIERPYAVVELFGARKGAWTDCNADVKGAVEAADHGVLFLDEVGDLARDAQATLLTFLDNGRYRRKGDDQERRADVRIVAATSVDLRKAVREGGFRQDLWQRLAVKVVHIAPLRERREDIVAYFQQATIEGSRSRIRVYDALTPKARQRVVAEYPWPGNFRELDSFVQRLCFVDADPPFDLDTCERAIEEGRIDAPPATIHLEPQLASLSDDAGAIQLFAAALAAYRARSNGEAPTNAAEFEELFEQVHKPMYFARALGLEGIESVPRNPTPSFRKMGRMLNCTDDTVKNQLERYVAVRPFLGRA